MFGNYVQLLIFAKELFLDVLWSKTAKKCPLFSKAVTVTRKYLNFEKISDFIVNADFREDSESGLGSKIGPTQPEIEKSPFWTLIADPAV